MQVRNVQCHSLAVGNRRKCNETAFHNNVQCHHSLAAIVHHDRERYDGQTAFHQNVQYHSLSVGHTRKKCKVGLPFTKMCMHMINVYLRSTFAQNITHLVTGTLHGL